MEQAATSDVVIRWLGRIDYRTAWELQHELVRRRSDGGIPDHLLVLEHPPVVTLGRQADPAHVRAAPAELERRGIELIRVERGGEVTYHGPGQLVAYPIVRLADRALLLRPFVRLLEQSMIDTAAAFGVNADRRDGYPGVWCGAGLDGARKIGSLGLRVERGVTYHGIALNVTTALSDFDLIDPCGVPDARMTSIAVEAGWYDSDAEPTTISVEQAANHFARAFCEHLATATEGARSLAGLLS